MAAVVSIKGVSSSDFSRGFCTYIALHKPTPCACLRYLCHFRGFLWVNPFRTARTHACPDAGTVTKPCNRFNVKQFAG